MDTEIDRSEQSELAISDVRGQINKIKNLMGEIMKQGEHYGTIPNCGSKQVLFKAGAEKLCFVFLFVPSFAVVRRDLDNGHREYEVLCTLTHRPSGAMVAQGIGLCSTMEKKYRYKYSKENPDIADTYNTVLKMAKKRAHVDATITACAASDIFTQDIGDPDEQIESRTLTTRPQSQPAKKQIDYSIVPSGNNAGKKWEELDKQTLHKSLTYYTEKRETRYAEIISRALRKHPITAAEETDILVDTHGDTPDVHATPTSGEDRDLFDKDK